MVNTEPWKRLPLKINWLIPKYKMDLCPSPPTHISVNVGFIGSRTNLSKDLEPEKFVTIIPTKLSESSEESEEVDQSELDESFLTLAEKIRLGF